MEKVIFLLIALSACYVTAQDGSSRIINGETAAHNQFPYAASLQQVSTAAQPEATRGHRCGGVLITLQHFLTTASCLFNNVNGVQTIINHAEYRVFAGSAFLNNDTVPERIRTIANITIHPQYVAPPANLNDIAIVTFITPFLATTVVPLPAPPADYEPADFKLCTVAGWGGAATNEPTSTQLRFATKYIYNQDLCTRIHNSQTGTTNVQATMVCAVSFDIVSAGCGNDYGNALVCNNTLTGLLFSHSNCAPTSFPELYTRVSNYTTWIRDITGSASTFTPGIYTLAFFALFQYITTKIVSQ